MREREFVEAVDAFLPLHKALVGAESPKWQYGRDFAEKRLKLPIEVGGEQRGQHLIVMAYPENHVPMFRICLEFLQKIVCRLDYEPDGSHANRLMPDGQNGLIHGPHWHAWELNRGCISSVLKYDKLPNAQPFTQAQKFDACLRWYCAERGIDLGHHGIVFPARERLL